MSNIARGDRRLYSALDGLRGVAALFVAMRHTVFFHDLDIFGGFMAVDLFFVLSGFVIAHAYEQRLAAGLSPVRFLILRYLRLWPVYALGALIGLWAAAAHALPARDSLTLAQVGQTAPYALAMLPGPHIKSMLYPVNSVAWSLALELLINAVYAFAWRWLRDTRVLVGALAVSLAALAFAVVWFGKLDVGFTWRGAWGGLPRVAFSFTAGLAVYRLHRSVSWRAGPWGIAPLVILPPLLWAYVDDVVFPLVCVAVVFPAMVFMAAGARNGPRLDAAFTWLGAASYPLYALHMPIGALATLALRHTAPHLVRSPGLGAVYLAALVALAYAVERLFDRPARRVLAASYDNLDQVLRPRLAAMHQALLARIAERRIGPA